jgi:hypothetical protein
MITFVPRRHFSRRRARGRVSVFGIRPVDLPLND